MRTFAYRLTLAPGLRIFKVHLRATKAEMRRRFADAGLVEPERGTLGAAFSGAGFEPDRSDGFFWAGAVS